MFEEERREKCYLCKRTREVGQMRTDAYPICGLAPTGEVAYRCASDVKECDHIYRSGLMHFGPPILEKLLPQLFKPEYIGQYSSKLSDQYIKYERDLYDGGVSGPFLECWDFNPTHVQNYILAIGRRLLKEGLCISDLYRVFKARHIPWPKLKVMDLKKGDPKEWLIGYWLDLLSFYDRRDAIILLETPLIPEAHSIRGATTSSQAQNALYQYRKRAAETNEVPSHIHIWMTTRFDASVYPNGEPISDRCKHCGGVPSVHALKGAWCPRVK